MDVGVMGKRRLLPRLADGQKGLSITVSLMAATQSPFFPAGGGPSNHRLRNPTVTGLMAFFRRIQLVIVFRKRSKETLAWSSVAKLSHAHVFSPLSPTEVRISDL